MKIFAKAGVIIALGTVLSWGAFEPALANTRLGSKLVTGSAIQAPLGMQVFCLKQPAYCRGGGQSQITMSDDVMALLKRTNSWINHSIRPRHDRSGDVWSINVSSGDCEDYVLTKRATLIEQGLPAGALRIATAYTARGEGHAVLVVRTDKGDFVLDNRKRAVLEWHQTDLRWVSLSSSNPQRWNRV